MKIKKVQYTVSEYADMIGVSKFRVYKFIEYGLIEIKRGKTGRIFILNKN